MCSQWHNLHVVAFIVLTVVFNVVEPEVGPGLQLTFQGLSLSFGLRSLFTESGVSLGMDRIRVFDPDQSRLTQHCNNTIITGGKPTSAVCSPYS